MTVTSKEEKRRIADLLFQEGRAIDELSNLRKSNESRKYDGNSVLKRSERTVGVRAARYGMAVRNMTEKK
jgi:hypothetical protein